MGRGRVRTVSDEEAALRLRAARLKAKKNYHDKNKNKLLYMMKRSLSQLNSRRLAHGKPPIGEYFRRSPFLLARRFYHGITTNQQEDTANMDSGYDDHAVVGADAPPGGADVMDMDCGYDDYSVVGADATGGADVIDYNVLKNTISLLEAPTDLQSEAIDSYSESLASNGYVIIKKADINTILKSCYGSSQDPALNISGSINMEGMLANVVESVLENAKITEVDNDNRTVYKDKKTVNVNGRCWSHIRSDKSRKYALIKDIKAIKPIAQRAISAIFHKISAAVTGFFAGDVREIAYIASEYLEGNYALILFYIFKSEIYVKNLHKLNFTVK
jgi:hypothetical protein